MALSVADRGYVLETGRIVNSGAGKALLADHLERLYLQQILAIDGMTELRAHCLFDYAFEGAFGVLVRCHRQAADPRETLSIIRDLLTGTLTFPW